MTEFNHGITDRQLQILTSNLNKTRVAKRKQGNSDLSYLEAWDIKATLIRVFGFGGFDAEVIKTEILDIEKTPIAPEGNNKGYTKIVACAMVTLRLTIHSLDAVYTESAVASQTGRDIGEVTDFAVKTAESDALKRCAIYLGTQFGLSLYDGGTTQDVVRMVFAPDQMWPKVAKTPEPEGSPDVDPSVSKVSESVEEILVERLGAQPVEGEADPNSPAAQA